MVRIKLRIYIVVLVVLFTLLNTASAQLNEVSGPVGFFSSIAKYTFYSSDFTLELPTDSYITSAEIMISLDTSVSNSIYVSVNGVYCNPDHWDIPASTQYKVVFDCSDVIKSSGTYTVRFYTTNDATNVKIDYKIIYGTQRRGVLSFFGTEYEVGDEATIFLQLMDENQEPINNATCLLDVYYPDKTLWFKDAAMLYLEGSDGLYYYELIVPEQVGVYMLSVKCLYITSYTYDYADDVTITDGIEVSGTYQDTWKDDGVYHVIEETVGASYRMDFYYDFWNVTVPDQYNGMLIYWIGKWTSDEEPVFIHLWDWCNNTWTGPLPNNITTNTPTVSNFLPMDEYNVSCLVSADGTVRLRFSDADPTEKIEQGQFMTDFVDVQLAYLTYGSVQHIRGAGEMHVSPRSLHCDPYTAGFYYPGDVVDVKIKTNADDAKVYIYNENDTLVTSGNATHLYGEIYTFRFTLPTNVKGLYTVYSVCNYEWGMVEETGLTTFYVSPTQLTLIQDKVYDIYDYLTVTVYDLLAEINTTVHNITINGELFGNLTEINDKLDYIIDNMATFEQVDNLYYNISSLRTYIESRWGNYTAQDIIDQIDSVGNDIITQINYVKSMLNCTEYSEVCNKLDAISSKVDTVIANTQTILVNQNLIMGNLTVINQNTEWLVDCLNVSCDDTWLSSRFDAIDTGITNIRNDLQDMNSTLYAMNYSMYWYYWDIMYKLETMHQELHSINITGNITVENLTQIINRLRDLNRTLILHDEFVRTDLKGEVSNIETMVDTLDDYIYINVTNKLDDIKSDTEDILFDTNSILAKWGSLTADDIWNKLNDIYSLLNTVYLEMATASQCDQILGNVTYLINYLETKYGSYDWAWLDSQLSSISSDVGDVYTLLYNHNITVAEDIADVKNKLDSVWGTHNAEEILNSLNDVYVVVNDTNVYLRNDVTDKLNYISGVSDEIIARIGSPGDTGTDTLFGAMNTTYNLLNDVYNDLEDLRTNYNLSLIDDIYNNINELKELHNCSIYNSTICSMLYSIENAVGMLEGAIYIDLNVPEIVYPGTEFKATLTILHLSGTPVDATNVTMRILDPSQNLVFEGTPNHIAQGAYKLDWSVPANPALGIYTIYAVVTVGNVTTTDYTVFRVAQTGPFDVIVHVLKTDIMPGEFVPAEITVKNQGEVGVDAYVTYWIEDPNGVKKSSAQETWFVPAGGEVTKDVQLYVPTDSVAGMYYFKAEVIYDVTRSPATGYDTFYVKALVPTPVPGAIAGPAYGYAPGPFYNVTFNVSVPCFVTVYYEGEKIEERFIQPGDYMLLKPGTFSFTFVRKGYYPVTLTIKVDKDMTITVELEEISYRILPGVPSPLQLIVMLIAAGVIIMFVYRLVR